MPSILPRDLDLDLSLESEARTTLTIVGVAIGVLVLSAALIFCKRPISRYFRRKMGLTRQNSNPAGETTTELAKAPPTFPLENMPVAHPAAPLGREQKPTDDHRRHGFFSPMRKYPSTPRYSNIHIYRGANGLHTPPPAKLVSSTRPPTMPSLSMHTFAHNAAWMDVADSVVGRHPHAKPLNSRVATKAEIEMISGHVHIPWAYNTGDKPQPVPVKVLKPLISYPAVPAQPGLLKDVGNINIGGRDIRVANHTQPGKGPDPKAQRAHRTRGKENMPAALPSSIRVRI